MASAIPENLARFELAEAARLVGARAPESAGVAHGVTTDSRADVRGKLFVALTGERFDAHEFVPGVLERGALAAVVARDVPGARGALLRVESPLGALGALAAEARRRWGGRVVAVAGRAGKTTTRSAIARLLEAVAPGQVHAPTGNLNNLIGVPMVLLGLEARHRFAVVELGTNAPGEVARLVQLARPDAGVLTLIALEHTEGLGDLDAIEVEEGSLLAGLSPTGIAIANADDERARKRLRASAAGTHVRYGARSPADYAIEARTAIGAAASEIRIARPSGPLTVRAPLLGEPGALAVAAAVAAVETLTATALERATVERALASGGEPGRLVPLELGDGTLVLDDTYNSNPGSVPSSIATAAELARDRAARLVLVLGEMRELGALSREAHAEMGVVAAASGAALVLGVAGDASVLVEAARRGGAEARFTGDAAAAAGEALAAVRPGDVVLVKASRGVHAERIVAALSRGAAS
ncbi:MAG: UDP-N-acetylmuramoyl-tripeptide--D-alanyl-D-alanine ligase [Polyangiaceae bacterium]|nr:UDP-N-acetylmuramoyl-tripeptide--D-alanyl-D-alanine ligase [Polyangiaceae bacterium]